MNLTNTSVRGALDRAEQLLQQADTLPVLIGTSGAAAAAPAAGVSFDSYLGGPYVISAPPAGLPASTPVLTAIRSPHPFASPPLPRVGDILRSVSLGAGIPVIPEGGSAPDAPVTNRKPDR